MTSKSGQNIRSTQANAPPTRRQLLRVLAAASVGTASFQRAIAQQAEHAKSVTADSIRNAEWVAGIDLTDEQRETAISAINDVLKKRNQLRAAKVDYDTLPAIRFDPASGDSRSRETFPNRPQWLTSTSPVSPVADNIPDHYSGCSIRQLAHLLRSKRTTAVQLTKQCIERLTEHDGVLKCVVNLTEELALQQAEKADQELAAGKDRGPLHGIPWGAKDLIAVAGYPTTWGAPQFQDRILNNTATVATKLADAGAVLVAKMSLGALAMGDKWFGGQTRNPWNTNQGSSGSSAGSASAVAARLLPFALGSETLGSIISPCRRCGVTGLRPTFGRVSRKDCMALSWTMDKIGPIAGCIDDCGIVFNAIHGKDPEDPCSVDQWFDWPMKPDLSDIKIGKIEGTGTSAADQATLEILKNLGAAIVPVTLPTEFPEWAISIMLDVEAATVFHDLIAAKNTEGLNQWPDIFRKSHFFSAVDYLHASRLRMRLMESMAEIFQKVDLYVGGNDLGISNLTGHPTVVFPTITSNSQTHSQPNCCTMTGRLYDEATLLAVAASVEAKVNLNLMPPLTEKA